MIELAYSNTAELIGIDPLTKALFKTILGIARIGTTAILIQGETGVGKEGCAKAIHYNSSRKPHPLVAVNCASIPDSLAESTWFGHKKGSFTGAVTDKPGYFEAAHGGVLFLDEVGDLSLGSQALLLRALQEKEVVRLGEMKPRRVDVRIVSATNKDLLAMIECGEFRRDLYYRLAEEPAMVIPPLRERPEDIRVLAESFLKDFNRQYKVSVQVEHDVLVSLQSHAWPGNVRELKSKVHTMVLNAARRGVDHVELADVQNDLQAKDPETIALRKSRNLQDKIIKSLTRNHTRTVRNLVEETGCHRKTVNYQLNHMEKCGLVRIERRRGRGGNIVHLRTGM